MTAKLNFPNPSSPVGPIVYVKEKTIWRYKLLVCNLANEEPPSEEDLNKLGKDGWELAATFVHDSVVYFYFKRLKD